MNDKRASLGKYFDGRVITLVLLVAAITILMSMLLPGKFFTASNFSGIFTSLAFDLAIHRTYIWVQQLNKLPRSTSDLHIRGCARPCGTTFCTAGRLASKDV